MKRVKPRIEKKLIAQVRYYEELHVVTDSRGERIYTGNKATAEKILRLLGHASPQNERVALVVRAKRKRRKAEESRRRQKVRRIRGRR